MITGKKDDSMSHSDVSKYSAIVFTNPIEKQISPPKNEPVKAETESGDDYSEDEDFDDDFEPYETSNEEEDKPSGESLVIPKSKEVEKRTP
jgi:hypothetical protein